MKLKILWFYSTLMDLYGDSGNIRVLKKRCLDRNIEVIVDTLDLDQEIDLKEYDLLFIGGGADNEQTIIFKDLLKRKEQIVQAINNKTFILLICGGYQLFGQYYKDQDQNIIDGLKIFDYYTEATSDGRCIGNIAVKTNLGFDIIGFENHAGQTKNVDHPLGKVISGHGNTYQGTHEGFYHNNCLGTYLHGPLLPKNPKLADYIIEKALEKNYGQVTLTKLDDQLENDGFNTMYQRITRKS